MISEITPSETMEICGYGYAKLFRASFQRFLFSFRHLVFSHDE